MIDLDQFQAKILLMSFEIVLFFLKDLSRTHILINLTKYRTTRYEHRLKSNKFQKKPSKFVVKKRIKNKKKSKLCFAYQIHGFIALAITAGC